MALNSNEVQEGYRCGAALKLADQIGLITDAIVAANGVKQVERLTVVGTVGAGGVGNITVNVKTSSAGPSALYNSGNGKNVVVAVANNDTATQVAGKIRTALDADADVAAWFAAAGGTGANVDMTVEAAAENDASLNLSYVNTTASGLTEVPTSTNQTAGKGVNDLIAAIEAAALPANASEVIREGTVKAIGMLRSLGLLTVPLLEPLTTVDGLIALSNVPSHYTARSFYD